MSLFSSFQSADLLWAGASYLKKAGISSFLLDARLLLQTVLECSPEFLITNPQFLCTAAQQERYEQMLHRRAQHEPVSKILGVKEFWGLPFFVTPDVLDPRPDSETLVEAVLEIYAPQTNPLRILDLGVGSGCLLLSLVHELPQATGIGVDLSKDALKIAQKNAQTLLPQQRVEFLHASWGCGIQEAFDIIVSNPPYIPTGMIETLAPEVKNFDPLTALDGGQDGLQCYRQLAFVIPSLLKNNGKVFVEIGQGQEKAVEEIWKKVNLHCLNWKKDLGGVTRCGVFSQQV